MNMNSSALVRVGAAALILLSAWAQIAIADEPMPPKETPNDVFEASRQSCELLRSGHFVMNHATQVDDPTADPEQAKAAGEDKAERPKVPLLQLDYRFDVERDLWRIELTNNWKPNRSPIPFVATLSPDWMVTGMWHTDTNGDRWLSLEKGTREEHFERLARSCIFFNVQKLIWLSTSRFSGSGTRKSDFKPPKQSTPEEVATRKDQENSAFEVTLSTDKRVTLVSRTKLPEAADIVMVLEMDFVRTPSILPTRIELIEEHATGDKFVRLSTNLEWSKRDGVYVPVRYHGRNMRQDRHSHWYEECDFELNWISVNKPIDPDEFDIEKQELPKRTIRSIHYLDTETTINPLVPPKPAPVQ